MQQFGKQNILQATIWLAALIVLFYVKEFYIDASIVDVATAQGLMPLALTLNNLFVAEGVSELSTILLVAINSILLTRIVIRNVLYTNRSHIIILLYFTLCSTIPAISIKYTSYLIATLSLISLELLLGIYKEPKPAYRIFMGGVAMACSSLMFAPAIIFIIPLIGALVLLERSDFKDYLTAILGYVTPILAYGYISWLSGGDILRPYNELYKSISSLDLLSKADFSSLSYIHILYILLLVYVIIYSLLFNIKRRTIQRAKAMRSYQLFLLMLLFMLTMIFLSPPLLQSLMPLLAVPVAIIASTMLIKKRNRRFVNIIYTLLMLGALAINLNDYITTPNWAERRAAYIAHHPHKRSRACDQDL